MFQSTNDLANNAIEDVYQTIRIWCGRFEKRRAHYTRYLNQAKDTYSQNFLFPDGQPGMLVYHDAYDDNQDLIS